MFLCPLYAWIYDNRGEFVGVPKESHFGEVDRAGHTLVSLPPVGLYGLLFGSPQFGASFDLDSLLENLTPEPASWGFGGCLCCEKIRFGHAMNWKLVIEMFGESYHFNTLHGNILALHYYGNHQAYDEYGRTQRLTLCLRSMGNMSTKQREEWDVLKSALTVCVVFPNVQLLVQAHGVTLM